MTKTSFTKTSFFLILTITVFILSIIAYRFNESYNKFDTGHNIKYLNCHLETNIVDISLSGDTKDSGKLIMEGGTGLISQFYNMGLFAFLFGVLVMYGFYNMKDKDKPIDYETLINTSLKGLTMSKNGSSPKYSGIKDDRRSRKHQE